MPSGRDLASADDYVQELEWLEEEEAQRTMEAEAQRALAEEQEDEQTELALELQEELAWRDRAGLGERQHQHHHQLPEEEEQQEEEEEETCPHAVIEEEMRRHQEEERAAWKARSAAHHEAQFGGADDGGDERGDDLSVNGSGGGAGTLGIDGRFIPEGMEMVPPPVEFGIDEAFDPATGRAYYYREATGETAWTREELVSSWTDTYDKALVRSMTEPSAYASSAQRRARQRGGRWCTPCARAAGNATGCACAATRAVRGAPGDAARGARRVAQRLRDACETLRSDPWLLPRIVLHGLQRAAHALALRAHKLATPLPPLDSATVGLLGWDEEEAFDTLVDHQTKSNVPTAAASARGNHELAVAAAQREHNRHELQHEEDEEEALSGVVVKKGRRHGPFEKGLRTLLHVLAHPLRLLRHRLYECLCHRCARRARERAAEARRLTPPAYRGPPVIRVLERHQLRQVLARFTAVVHYVARRERARVARRAARRREDEEQGGATAAAREGAAARSKAQAAAAAKIQQRVLAKQPQQQTSQELLEEGGVLAVSVQADGSVLVSRPPPPSAACTHAEGSSRHRFREQAAAKVAAQAARIAATPSVSAAAMFSELLEAQHSAITCAVFDLAGVDLSGGSGGSNSAARRRRMNHDAESPVDFCAFVRVLLTLALMTDEDVLRFAFFVMDPDKRAGVPKDELREFVHVLHPTPMPAQLSKKAAKKAAKKHMLEHHKAVMNGTPSAFEVAAPQAHKRIKRGQLLNKLLDKVPESWLNFRDVAEINRRCPQLLFPLFRMQRAAMAIGPGTSWWRRRKIQMARQQADGAVMRGATANRAEHGELTAWQMHMANHRHLVQRSHTDEAEAADARADIDSSY